MAAVLSPRPCAALEAAPRAGGERSSLDARATQLMARYRETRSPAVFEALYALTAEDVRSWILGLGPRGQRAVDPDEVLQDTFVNAFRYPSGFRDEHEGSFRVWIRTIAANALRRSGGRRRAVVPLELSRLTREPIDPREDPPRRVEDDEQTARLRCTWLVFLTFYGAAYRTLSERDRRTLELVEVAGLSYREASRELGVGAANLKMIVFRARKRLARAMRRAMNGAVSCPEATRDVA